MSAFDDPAVVQCMSDTPWDFDRVGPPWYDFNGDVLVDRIPCGGYSHYTRKRDGTLLAVRPEQFGG